MTTSDGAVGLFGWPAISWENRFDTATRTEAGRLRVFGVPVEFGNAIRKGTARAPALLRDMAGAIDGLVDAGLDIGDLPHELVHDPAHCLDHIADRVARMREAGLYPLMLGGDHSLSYGPISALAAAGDLCVVWFDAHTDFSEWSPSVTHDHKQVLRRVATLKGVRRIVQVGYRGITTGDERDLGPAASVITTAQARHMDVDAFLAQIPESMPCYVSIDIDVIDPLLAPGTGAPVPDGLLPCQVRDWLEALIDRRPVVGLDLVECNPALDPSGATLRIGLDLLAAAAHRWVSPGRSQHDHVPGEARPARHAANA